jgi:serine phosphatase RsbU (regulator of sigma subunit)
MKMAVEELTALNQIASAINVSMSVDKITQITVDHMNRRLKSQQGAVFLLESDGGTEERFKTFVREMTPESGGVKFRLNMALSGWMIKNRTILLSNEPATDNRLVGVDFAQMGITSLLAAPLLSRNGLIGVMAVFNKQDPAGFTEQDKRFIGIVSTQATKVIENARLFEQERKLQTIELDIQRAKAIQQGFLPRHNLKHDTWEIFGYSSAAREVGGDYYDMHQLDDHRVFFSLGDVAGKGIPAALLMSNAQAVTRSHLRNIDDDFLGRVSDSLNRLICQFTTPEQYLTGVLGFYDTVTHILHYVNAGHLPILILRRDGSVEPFEDSDLVIGVMPDIPYRTQQVQLNPGDTAVIYSDGVTECFNEKEEEFGHDRLVECLKTVAGKSAEEINGHLLSHVLAFRGKAEQSDDVTILVIAVRS